MIPIYSFFFSVHLVRGLVKLFFLSFSQVHIMSHFQFVIKNPFFSPHQIILHMKFFMYAFNTFLEIHGERCDHKKSKSTYFDIVYIQWYGCHGFVRVLKCSRKCKQVRGSNCTCVSLFTLALLVNSVNFRLCLKVKTFKSLCS